MNSLKPSITFGESLGTHEKFNCCGETLDDTLGRLEAIRQDMILPALMSADPEYESYTKISVDGFWYFNPLDNHYDYVADDHNQESYWCSWLS